jgi:hypothetical protein
MKGRKAAVIERKKENCWVRWTERKKGHKYRKKETSKGRIKHERQENSRICFQDKKV